mgnify:CR=1 FL=1
MTYEQFMQRLQDYYGPYPGKGKDQKGKDIPSKVPDYVIAYLRRDVDEQKLERLFRYITYSHPARFGPPGISDIEKAIEQARYKGKGEDVHRGAEPYQMPEVDIPTPEEQREAERMIQEAGGLRNMFRNMVRERRFEDNSDQKEVSGW